jgi:hypothetical protein
MGDLMSCDLPRFQEMLSSYLRFENESETLKVRLGNDHWSYLFFIRCAPRADTVEQNPCVLEQIMHFSEFVR